VAVGGIVLLTLPAVAVVLIPVVVAHIAESRLSRARVETSSAERTIERRALVPATSARQRIGEQRRSACR
jgi:hypothetical protein